MISRARGFESACVSVLRRWESDYFVVVETGFSPVTGSVGADSPDPFCGDSESSSDAAAVPGFDVFSGAAEVASDL